MKRRSFLKAAAGTAATASLAPTRFAIGQPANARTLVFVPQANLTLLDPIFTTAQPTVHHGYAIYDLLFGVTAKLEVRPQMAEGYTVSDDGRAENDLGSRNDETPSVSGGRGLCAVCADQVRHRPAGQCAHVALCAAR